MTDLDAQAVGVVAAREAKSRGFPEPEAKAFGWGAKWVAGRLPSRDEIGSVIHEKFNDCRGRGGVDPYRLADEVLALIREHVTRG